MKKSVLEEMNKRKVECSKEFFMTYFEQMEKTNVLLKSVKFTNDIQDCEICDIAKIENHVNLFNIDMMNPYDWCTQV